MTSHELKFKCLRCFEPLPGPSEYPVSLQEGILDTQHHKEHQDTGYEFAVFLCNSCGSWKKVSGKMKEVTSLKFPGYDPAARTLYLPPITNIQREGAKSISYPVSMLVNKAKSLLERFKDEASLSSPPTVITGCMMYMYMNIEKIKNKMDSGPGPGVMQSQRFVPFIYV